jgi:hypothetical protein
MDPLVSVKNMVSNEILIFLNLRILMSSGAHVADRFQGQTSGRWPPSWQLKRLFIVENLGKIDWKQICIKNFNLFNVTKHRFSTIWYFENQTFSVNFTFWVPPQACQLAPGVGVPRVENHCFKSKFVLHSS